MGLVVMKNSGQGVSTRDGAVTDVCINNRNAIAVATRA
jgi:hypothetical protein